MELTEEQKEQMRKNRLLQYKQQIYSLEMDVVALEAIGEDTSKKKEEIKGIEKAYQAIEVMK